MSKPWFDQYDPWVPHEIDADAYSNVVDMLLEANDLPTTLHSVVLGRPRRTRKCSRYLVISRLTCKMNWESPRAIESP